MTIADFINLLIPLYIALFLVAIGFFSFKKLRNKGKIPCMVLTPGHYTVERKKTEGSKVLFSNWKRNPEYDANDFYEEDKPFYKFWRLPTRLLVIPKNAKRALKWGKRGPNDIIPAWTKKEDKEYIAKMVAKARQKGQLISNTWGILILASIAVVFLTVFLGFSRIGAF